MSSFYSYELEKDFKALPIYKENSPLKVSSKTQKKIKNLISFIWEKENPEEIYQGLLKIIKEAYQRKSPQLIKRDKNFDIQNRWSEKDFYFICYGDHLKSKKKKIYPLKVLSRFLHHYFNPRTFPGLTIHFLPLYKSPYKDGGFDVANPFKINQIMGDWKDVAYIARNYKVALDFVVNHLSKDCPWFKKFLNDDSEFKDFFIAFDEENPVQMAKFKQIREKYQKLIYRPRAHDPFVRVKKKNGKYTWVYMTFSNHQPDVNYANPKVFLKMTEIMLYYVLRGASTLRIDAVPYLWKEWGTSCVHHKKTHALVELFRIVLDVVSPSTKLLSESMEPPQDSARYLSSGKTKKAHMAYNFTPCGLIPFTLIHEDASRFQKALRYFQTSSNEIVQAVVCGKTHDGSSFNACRAPKSVKGKAVLSEKEINQLADFYTKRGLEKMPKNFAKQFKAKYGEPPRFANYKTITDSQGKTTQIVYEAISTYASLFKANPNKVVAALAMGLPLKGIPFIYFTALFAVLNDYQLYLKTGNPRELNRGRLYVEKLKKDLKNKKSLTYKVFNKMLVLLKIRITNKAFHPNGWQKPISAGNKAIFSLLRMSPDKKEKILTLHNISSKKQKLKINLNQIWSTQGKFLKDIISKKTYKIDKKGEFVFSMKPYQILWLKRFKTFF